MSTASHGDYARSIVVRGARVSDLRGVDVDIPRRKVVVLTGVSGSGESSLAFDTVAAESQRMLNEAYQAPMGANSRSTVGTATDTVGRLRTLFAQHSASRRTGRAPLSFNDPQGACPDCEGTGQRAILGPSRVLDETRSLNDRAITLPLMGQR